MPRNLPTIGLSAAAGCCLGAWQVVRENQAGWSAEHATPVTIIIQSGAGALIGGAFAAGIMAYLLSRRRPTRRVAAPPPSRPARPRPSAIRHGVILLFAIALLAVGAIVLLACLKHPTVYGVLRGGFGAAFLMALGGYLIWDDFIAPRFNAGTSGERPPPDDTRPGRQGSGNLAGVTHASAPAPWPTLAGTPPWQ